MLSVFLLLLFAHALADYPLQGGFLSRAKNRWAPIDGVPWYQAMAAHCCIHAGLVYVVTGSLACAGAELVVHFVTDHNKCAGRLSFNADQSIHLACKLAWAALATS